MDLFHSTAMNEGGEIAGTAGDSQGSQQGVVCRVRYQTRFDLPGGVSVEALAEGREVGIDDCRLPSVGNSITFLRHDSFDARREERSGRANDVS